MSIARKHTATLITGALVTASLGAGFAMQSASATPTPHDYAVGVVTAKTGVIARYRPSTKAPKTGSLARNSRFTIACKVKGTRVDGNPAWYLVKSMKGARQWVAARYVRTTESPNYCDPTDSVFPARAKMTVNLRMGPSLGDAKQGRLVKGAKVQVQCYTGAGNQKWALTTSGRWVFAYYLTTTPNLRYCAA